MDKSLIKCWLEFGEIEFIFEVTGASSTDQNDQSDATVANKYGTQLARRLIWLHTNDVDVNKNNNFQ